MWKKLYMFEENGETKNGKEYFRGSWEDTCRYTLHLEKKGCRNVVMTVD